VYKTIEQCRICGNKHLEPVLNLGEHQLTGVFPKNKNEIISSGPLELVLCSGPEDNCCGLLQLRHSYDLSEMYGFNYGYRSGLNQSMVRHLHGKVAKIMELTTLLPGDLIIDIGSNDSTLLQAYPLNQQLNLVGIDPTGSKFKRFYPDHIKLIPDFFSENLIKNTIGDKKAKIITSIAMFYDLESPTDFMVQVRNLLAEDGVWIFEQSYMPTMFDNNAYDTVCHEHLEYYSLRQIEWMTERTGLKIIDIEVNDVNGGSFSVTVSREEAPFPKMPAHVRKILNAEKEKGFTKPETYNKFRENVFRHRDELISFVRSTNHEGEKILGYGASTKGNVILQFCGFTDKDIPCIAEVNQDKFGAFTPGTMIPIVSEEDARFLKPDYFMVFPWHFKHNIIKRERKFIESGGKMIFPLPVLSRYP